MSKIEIAFRAFHAANPHVYTKLVGLAREWKSKGNGKAGIKMFFEVLRWQAGLRTIGDEFLLNNNFHSYYAREMMQCESDLAGIFNLRKLHWTEPDDYHEQEAHTQD